MAQAQQLGHRPIRNPSLPYDSYGSPVKATPVYIAGSNVLTSLRGYLERFPGFAAFENTPTTFAVNSIEKIYVVSRWNNNFFVFLSQFAGSTRKVYKLKVGTDNSFVAIQTDTSVSAGTPYNFVFSDNFIFMADGSGGHTWKYDGTTVTRWGIVPPAAAPTTSTSGTGITAVFGWQYVYAYANSNDGSVSDISPASASTGAVANKTVNVSVVASADSQVTGIRIFRTTDGGGGIFFEINGSPFPNVTQSNPDTTTDALLSIVTAPVAGYNAVPPNLTSLTWYANRIWGFGSPVQTPSKDFFSGWEEINIGLEEECWPGGIAGNFFTLDNAGTGQASATDFKLDFTANSIHRIDGISLDTFSRSFLVKNMGVRSAANIALLGKLVAWLNVDSSVWITDGISLWEISIPIRNDIKGIDHFNSSLVFFNQGLMHWLILFDGPNNRAFVFDLDTQQWMPPRNFGFTLGQIGVGGGPGGGVPCYAGETAIGVQSLLVASTTQVLVLTPTAYTDAGATYSSTVTTNLFDLVPGGFEVYTGGYGLGAPGGHLGEPEYVSLEMNNILPSQVQLLVDDDPFLGQYGEPISNIQDPPNRIQPVDADLLEKYYYQRFPASRRAAMKVTWAAANSNFKLYSFDFAYRLMQ